MFEGEVFEVWVMFPLVVLGFLLLLSLFFRLFDLHLFPFPFPLPHLDRRTDTIHAKVARL